jgi:DNA-binding XRE family transcriptional regulator
MAQVIDFAAVKRDYARRLRVARKRLGWTQQTAAYELGTAIRTYQAWEDPDDETLPDGKNAITVQRRMRVALLGNTSTARYTGHPDWPMLTPAPALAVASG